MKQSELTAVAQIRIELGNGTARARREAAMITQTDVAATLDVAPSTVSQWESGVRRPSVRHALAYHRLLGKLPEPGPAADQAAASTTRTQDAA